MLGFIGLLLASILVGVFSISFYSSFKDHIPNQVRNFSNAFLLLSLSLFTWSLIPLLNSGNLTQSLIFTGDALLVLGTCLLILSQFSKSYFLTLPILITLASLLIVARAQIYESSAFVMNGLLYFNLSGVPQIVIVAILTLIWLPLGLRFTKIVTNRSKLPYLSAMITASYIMALISALIFINSRRDIIMVLSFAAMCLAFLTLSTIPSLTKRLIDDRTDKHTHKKARS